MTVRLKPLLALTIALAALAAAPAAAQQAPSLGAPDTQTQTAVQPSTGTTSGNGGLKTWQEVLIFAAGLALIAGIAFAILGDARERAGRLRHGKPEPATSGAMHRHRAQAKERARARTKAARAQRRRNR
jgi:hypothetical protein